MINTNILSKIWEGQWNHKISEELNFENTFIQQTSGSRNLWKVQLGQTENYVLFFKQEVTLTEVPTNRFLLHMSPKHSLCVRKCSGRKLEVKFPDGCPSIYKLPIARGCGTTWVKWRSLQYTCGQPPTNERFQPLFAIFNLRELGDEVLQMLEDRGFMTPMFLTNKGIFDDSGWLRKLNSMEGGDGNLQSAGSKTKGLVNLRSRISKWLEKAEGDASKKEVPKGKVEGKQTLVKKSRVVQRFGEGVPEGCTFSLSLSGDYPTDNDINAPVPSSRRILSSLKRSNSDLNIFQYLCEEKLASEEAYRMNLLESMVSSSHRGVADDPRPVRIHEKNIFESLRSSLKASHSLPLQNLEENSADSENPQLKASHSLPFRNSKKNIANSTKPPVEASHSPSVRRFKDNLVESEGSLLKISHSLPVQSSKKHLVESEEFWLKTSHSLPVKSSKKNLADSAKSFLVETSHPQPVRFSEKNLVESDGSLLRTSHSQPVHSSKQQLNESEGSWLKTSHSHPVQSSKINPTEFAMSSLKTSQPLPDQFLEETLVESEGSWLKTSHSLPVQSSEKNYADSQLKTSHSFPVRSSEQSFFDSVKPSLEGGTLNPTLITAGSQPDPVYTTNSVTAKCPKHSQSGGVESGTERRLTPFHYLQGPWGPHVSMAVPSHLLYLQGPWGPQESMVAVPSQLVTGFQRSKPSVHFYEEK